MTAPACCYHADSCNRRRAKGQLAWCDPALKAQLAAIPAPVRPANEFSTYAAAEDFAKCTGGKVRRAGEYFLGNVRRFYVDPA